jgi:hypothetical protein
MNSSIPEPMAEVHIRWRSPSEGGRRSGPPPGPEYAATAVFMYGDDTETQPNWPASGEHFSVRMEYASPLKGSEVTAVVDFLAPDLVQGQLREGARFLIMEGPRAVGEATVISLLRSERNS